MSVGLQSSFERSPLKERFIAGLDQVMLDVNDDDRFSVSVLELIRLFKANDNGNPIETIMRIRALFEISNGVSTHDLALNAQAVSHAMRSRCLGETLNGHLAEPPGGHVL